LHQEIYAGRIEAIVCKQLQPLPSVKAEIGGGQAIMQTVRLKAMPSARMNLPFTPLP
jgi:hypothetical protein